MLVVVGAARHDKHPAASVGVRLPQSVPVFLRRRQPALLESKHSLQTDSFLQNQLAKCFPSFPSILTNH